MKEEKDVKKEERREMKLNVQLIYSQKEVRA
jgi:hypothetical protein